MPSEEYEIAGKEQFAHVYAPDYDEIVRMRKDLGVLTESFLALKEEHDPFYAGLNSHIEDAKWFKDHFEMCGYTSGMHLRRMHYQLVSQDPKIKMRNGRTYENTDDCWKALGVASLAARYLEYVDPANFDDRRNGDAIDHADYSERKDPTLGIKDNKYMSSIDMTALDLQLPDYTIELPEYQPYHMEMWCEKSTQDDILVPLAEKYQIVLRHGMGELSVTIALEALNRFQEAGKPVRIFYLSDFDPNGWNMPKSMSRKVQFFNRKKQEFGLDDIKLFHFFLTPEQALQYRLPRTPIKESNPSKGDFEDRFGIGATELDALEALYPGELQKILSCEIERYYDPSLAGRIKTFHRQVQKECNKAREKVYEIHAEKIEELESKRSEAIEAIQQIIDEYQIEQDRVFGKIQDSLTDHMPELDEENVPLAREADENREPLFDSSRPFLDQNAYYREHLGKPVQYAKSKGRKRKAD